MIVKWEQLKTEIPEAIHIIQEGLDKLETYENYTDLTPAYSLAMGKSVASFTNNMLKPPD